MRTPTASEFLAIWERGLERPPWEQALDLLEAACPEAAREDLTMLSIGRRDSLLFRLRERAFGPHMKVLAGCPRCRLPLELEMDTRQFSSGEPEQYPAIPDHVTITVANRNYRLRAPNTADLAAASGMNTKQASERILSLCLGQEIIPAESVGNEAVSAELTTEALAAIAELDPIADIRIELNCAACSRSWSERFDIVSFLWTELDAWARRILREVHDLALSYGWSEAEILSLSPLRRRFYLEMAGV